MRSLWSTLRGFWNRHLGAFLLFCYVFGAYDLTIGVWELVVFATGGGVWLLLFAAASFFFAWVMFKFAAQERQRQARRRAEKAQREYVQTLYDSEQYWGS